ncbi:MAG: hypothetical protein HY298_10025 [Verrucomicrobia bacterium]|nr:hypothetical protein [Verrucomicrobiota bacterium]
MRAETLRVHYASYGELIVTQLASAPFPHPQRAEGHQYKDRFYPADKHYSDSSVAIFIPTGFRESGKTDFVVHFHGWRNYIEIVFNQYQLIEQFIESGRNAILVVPQGPFDACDSFGGKLEDVDGFKRFMEELMDALHQKRKLKTKEIGNVILSGHSGGYRVISFILAQGGMTGHVKEVWLFDALFGQTEKFVAWLDLYHGRLINIYTPHGRTKEEAEKWMTDLQQKRTEFLARKENEVTRQELEKNKLIFLFTELGHNDVLAKHRTFREFLNASCLTALR